MKVKVGLVGIGTMSTHKVTNAVTGVVEEREVFHADTVTIWLEQGTRDTENMHKGNFKSVALAVARRKLQADVFPIEIEEPDWLPERAVKGGAK